MAIFLIFWAVLVRLAARTAHDILPAVLAGDPAALAVGLILTPWLFYLAQGLFYLPRRPSGPPLFIGERLFSAPLVFLPFPSRAKMETGPALEVLTTPEERAALLSEAEERLRSFNGAARLSLLLEARSPLDLILTRLSGRSPVVAWPAALIYLIMGPARQLMRLWGFIFFLIWRAWDDPGPESEALAEKRDAAHDLENRLPEAEPLEPPVEEAVRLRRILAALRRVYHNPAYGGAADAAEDEAAGALYRKPYLAPRYYGLYLDLPLALAAATVAEMYDGGNEEDPSVFYPPELGAEVERAALLKARRDRLKELAAQAPPDGLVRFGGRLAPSRLLRAEARDCQVELDRLYKRLAAHHRRCRSSHLAAAVRRGAVRPEALRSLAGLIHRAEHERRTLTLAIDAFLSALDPRTPPAAEASDLGGLLSPARALPAVIRDIHGRLSRLALPAELEARDGLAPAVEPPPGGLDPDSWINVWEPLAVNLFSVLETLRDQALSRLIKMEESLEAAAAPDEAPVPVFQAEAEDDYPALKPEPPPREMSRSTAEALGAGFGRSAAALAVMALLLWQGQTVGHSRVVVYNGLGLEVTVAAGGRSLRLEPFGHGFFKLPPNRVYEVTASAADGRPLESFKQRLAPRPAVEVYNIAGAAPLMEWRSPPGGEAGRFLGRPRWLLTEAEVLFRQPPPGRAGKLVLSGYGDVSPAEMLDSFESRAVRDELIRLHATWDAPDSPWFRDWQALLSGAPQIDLDLLESLWEQDFLIEEPAQAPEP